MIRSVSFSVSKLDKRVNIRIRERVQIQSMTGFVSKWNSLMEWSALDPSFETTNSSVNQMVLIG